MAQSMQRLDPGRYTINIGGTVYNVTKEDRRVETGRSKRGTVKQVWVARRGDGYLLEESPRYRDAKNAVFADAELPPEQRPTAALDGAETHDDGTEQPSLFEGTAQADDAVPASEAVGQAPTVAESPAFTQHVENADADEVVTAEDHGHDEAPVVDESHNEDQTHFAWS